MPFSLPVDVHQVLSPSGQLVGEPPELPPDELVNFYRWMVVGRTFSQRMIALQRQGRMGTFGPSDGQEAASIGIAAPLQANDWMVGSYRDVLSCFYRGAPMLASMERWRGYVPDNYGRNQKCLPDQIVLATQVLHGLGLAMAMKYRGESNIAVAMIGDGASSEGDFNEALNAAAVYKAPIVFVVINNGWAISTPRAKQSAAQYIAHRGVGFGMPARIADGNDVLATYQVIEEAAARARRGDGPTLVELITYRLGAHTTADDPTKYRDPAEVAQAKQNDPMIRFWHYINALGLVKPEDKETFKTEAQTLIQKQVDMMEGRGEQPIGPVFDTVYANPTPQLMQQKEQFQKYLGRA